MARTRGRKSDAKSPKSNQADNIDGFLLQLADVLRQSGNRSWKVKQIGGALRKAADSLPEGPTKSELLGNLDLHAAALHALLVEKSQVAESQPTSSQPAKRSKRAREEPIAVPPTFLDDSLTAVVGKALQEGKIDASLSKLAPLLARTPAPAGYIEWLAARSNCSETPGDVASALHIANLALQLCNAVAGRSSTAEAAVAAFGPAISCMRAAVDALLAQTPPPQGGTEMGELEAMAARALFCLQTVRVETELAGNRPSNGFESGWLLEWTTPQTENESEEESAERVCAELVFLRTLLRWAAQPNGNAPAYSVVADTAQAALISAAAADIAALAPCSVMGVLKHTLSTPVGGVEARAGGATCALALYMAAARQDATDLAHYMAALLAARRAAAIASATHRHTLGSTILATAASRPAPQDAYQWLRAQPPSAVVLAALAALAQGREALAAHLVRDASEGALAALATAARAGGAVSGAGPGGEAWGEGGDELLFFVSKEGDRTAFGGEWGGSDGEENHTGSDSDGEVGVRLEELADVGKGVASDDGSEGGGGSEDEQG